jgi:glycosyltransferase involved in cell wall biosynthesis
MRIAVLSTPFIRVPPTGYGGTELFCWELSEELAARGHEVTLYTTGDSVTRCRRRSLYHRAEWPPTAQDDVNHVAWAFSEIARGGFDIVQLNSSLGVPFSRFVSVPIVHTIHHHREEPISRVFAAHPRVVYVAVSRRQLALETPLARSAVIHHGVSPERYEASLRDEGYLLHLGRYAIEKGTHLAIDAARLAGLPLKLAGRTHAPDVEYFAQEIRPRLEQEGVEELGEAEHDRKVALLRGARALLCPLQWEEPFGLVAIEAMLCGTPVIGFPRGSFPEIIDEGVTGFLAPNRDVTAMARIAASLARFDRAACARRARERFSTQVMTDAYERLYERVVRSPIRASARAG